MKKTLLLLTWLLVAPSLWAQPNPEAYRLYDGEGKPVEFATMMADLARQDVVLVGEMHNCVICHWMERRILQSLHAVHGARLAVGMEMLEADNQLIIDEYQRGLITANRYEAEVRLWPNYETDYAPLADYAVEHSLPLVATNVPRRYANAVKNHGLAVLDSLSDEARRYLPPLPIDCHANEQMGEAMSLMGMMGGGKSANPEWMGQSQALKDATMAWNIARWKESHVVVHFNGNYHADGGEGIPAYLKQYWPGVRCKNLYSVRQEDISTLETDYLGKGDYYLCVPNDMPTSY